MRKSFFTFINVILISLVISCNLNVDTDVSLPSISSISNDINGILNSDISVFITANNSDDGVLSYEWFKADDKLSDGVRLQDSNHEKIKVDTTSACLAYYYCIVTNTINNNSRSVISPRIAVRIIDKIDALPPIIVAQPQNVSSEIGIDIEISVIAYSQDEGSLSYQWYFKNTEDDESEYYVLNNETNDSVQRKFDLTHIGKYYCVITNTIENNGDGGNKNASIVTNEIIVSNNIVNANAPVIIQQPQSLSAVIPAARTFTVGAYSPDGGNLHYQWYKILEGNKEGEIINEANTPTLTIYADSIGKNGYYCIISNCIIDNGDGGNKEETVISDIAWFDCLYLKNAIPAPYFINQPTKMNIAPYNESVQLTCKAESDTYEISYHWYSSKDGTTENGLLIPGANKEIFETPIFTEPQINYYYCVATCIIPESESENVKSTVSFSDVVSVAYTGLPTLYLNTGDTLTKNITKESYLLGDFKLISKEYGTTEYTFSKESKEGIKGRGNMSWSFPKKGYNIKFDKKQSFFGLPAAKKWCIIANYSDKTLLRNKLASISSTKVFNDVWNPSFIHVDVVMNNEYMGNYIFCEKITITKGRVDIQDISDVEEYLIDNKLDKIKDSNGDGNKDLLDGGFIIEVEKTEGRAAQNDFYFHSNTQNKYYCLNDPDEVSETIQDKVKDCILTAESVLFDDDIYKGTNGWRKYIDEDSAIDFYFTNEFGGGPDNGYSSDYLYYEPKDGLLHLGPCWDFDNGFGNNGLNGQNPEFADPTLFTTKRTGWFPRLFSDPVFVDNVKLRWNEKKLDLYSELILNMQNFADELAVSAEYNFMKWPILGSYVWPNPAGYENRTTYQSEIDYLIDWLGKRYEWMDSAINNL